jgi:hypothetical protein
MSNLCHEDLKKYIAEGTMFLKESTASVVFHES